MQPINIRAYGKYQTAADSRTNILVRSVSQCRKSCTNKCQLQMFPSQTAIKLNNEQMRCMPRQNCCNQCAISKNCLQFELCTVKHYTARFDFPRLIDAWVFQRERARIHASVTDLPCVCTRSICVWIAVVFARKINTNVRTIAVEKQNKTKQTKTKTTNEWIESRCALCISFHHRQVN